MNPVKQFKETGVISGLTYRQATSVISRATGNDIVINPNDPVSFDVAQRNFGDNNSGSYPSLSGTNGGLRYTTISGRDLEVYPDANGYTLDCGSWWFSSENFKGSVIGSLRSVFKDRSLCDKSLPGPIPEHVHEVEVGRTYYLDYTPVNNHGCSGFSVEVRAISPTEGVVVDGRSCSSCWQVGHDDSSSPVQIGSKVQLPEGYCWECASEEDPDFMSSRDVSRNSRTMVEPSDLIILEQPVEDTVAEIA